MRAWICAALIAVLATPVFAGNKVKAEFLCGTYVDGEVKDMVPNPKKPRLTDPVACALRLDAGDGYQANVHTVRYAVDAASGKKSTISTQGKTDEITPTKDLELVMQPGVKDDAGEVDFQSCEDFDVVATIYDDHGTLFTKKVHVAQACPKPKPMKAFARCEAAKGDDTFDVPNKQARRLEVDRITCYVTSKDKRFNGSDLTFNAQTVYDAPNSGNGPTLVTNDPHKGMFQEGEDESAFSVEIPPDDIPTCLPSFDIKLFLDDMSGAHLFAKTITVKQKCDD